MKLFKRNPCRKQKESAAAARRRDTRERLLHAAREDAAAVCAELKVPASGLTEDQIDELRDLYGRNTLSRGKKASLPKRVL